MDKMPISPNYDSAKFKILGLFSIQAVIEGGVCSVILFFVLNSLLSMFTQSFEKDIILIAICAVVFCALTMLFDVESVLIRSRKMIRFYTLRRTLRFRSVRRRAVVDLPEEFKDVLRVSKVSYERQSIDAEDEKNQDAENTEESSESKSIPDMVVDVFKDIAQVKGENLFDIKNQIYCQEAVNVEDVYTDGIIKRKDGAFVKILEISPVNFHSQKVEKQTSILSNFLSYMSISPVVTQFKIMTTKPDVSEYVHNLRAKTNRKTEKSEKVLELLDAVIEDVENQSQYGAYEQKFLLILSYAPRALDEEEALLEAAEELFNAETTAIEFLANSGNRIVEHESEVFFALDTIYRYYNKRSSENEPFINRYEKIMADCAKAQNVGVNQVTNVKTHHFVSPRSLNFTKKDYIFSDGQFHTYMTISDYPAETVPGFIQYFTSIGEGIEVDLFIKKEDREKMRTRVAHRLSNLEAETQSMPPNSTALQNMINVCERANLTLLDPLNEGQDFYYFEVVICISGKTIESVNKRKRYILERCKAMDFRLNELTYLQEEAFYSCAPLCDIRLPIFEVAKRNAAEQYLPVVYPFTSASIKQNEGIAMGINIENSSPVILDIFNPISNISVFGVTGYGKSFTTMEMLTRLRLMQTQVFVIAPLKGHEYNKLSRALCGSYIPIGPGIDSSINIMEIRPVNSVGDISASDEEDIFVEVSYLVDKVQELMGFFTLACNNITDSQLDMLNPELIKLYHEFGITEDNTSIFKKNNPETGQFKDMPVIGDLYERLLRHHDQEMRLLAKQLEKFVHGNLKFFNRQTNVDLNNKFCVLDLSTMYKTEYFPLGLYIAQNHVWRKVKANRTQKKCIVFEEAWTMLKYPESAELVKETWKTCRAYGCLSVAITQSTSDFTNCGEVGRALLDNSLINIFMHLSSSDAAAAKEYFDLTQAEYQQIVEAKKGYALITTREENYFTKIIATSKEAELFETDRNNLEKQLEASRMSASQDGL